MFESLLASLQSLQGMPAYALVFGILAGSGLGLPMNEDILLVTAAALTLSGVMQPWLLVVTAWFGLVIADALIFHWGRVFGSRLVEHRLLSRVVSPSRLSVMQAFMRRMGPAAIFIARFMPGLRSGVYFAAGSLKLRYRTQVLFDGMAAAIELPLLVFAVRFVGERARDWTAAGSWTTWLLAASVLIAAMTAAMTAAVRMHRKRRRATQG